MPRSTLRRALTALVPVLLLLTLAAWALSSPVGSSPDDDFHLPSIYCGLGEREGLCEETGAAATRLVPASTVGEACYTRDSTTSGACWPEGGGGMAETDRVNTGPLYPPLFYATMSIFAGPDVVASVLAMRLFNAVLAAGTLTALFFASPARIRPAVVIGVLASAVPLGLFIIPSTNASSWAFVSAATVWPALYGATQTAGKQRIVLSALALFGAVIGAGARADAAAFAVFGVIVAAILGLRWRRDMWFPAATGALIVLICALFYLSAGQGGSVIGGLPSSERPLTRDQLLSNLLDVPSLWVGVFGGWELGWFDTPLPDVVWVFGFGAFAALIFIGVRAASWRRATALATAVAALWIVPFVLLVQSNAVVGTYVQPRYILPLVVITAGLAALPTGRRDWWNGAWSVVGGVVLAVSAAIALHVNLRRYTTGLDDLALDPGSRAEWWWSAGPSPLAWWLIALVAFAAVFPALEYLRRTGPLAERDAVTIQDSRITPGVDSPGLRLDPIDRPATP